MQRNRALGLVVSLSLLASRAAAQRTGVEGAERAIPTLGTEWPSEELEARQLPVPVRLTSPARLVAALQSIKKGTYESTTAFAARVTRLLGGSRLYGLSALSDTSRWCSYASLSYDADKEELTIHVGTRDYPLDILHRAIQVGCRRTVTGSYRALSAFGVEKTVHRVEMRQYFVGSRGSTRLNEVGNTLEDILVLPVPRAQAAREIPDYRVLVAISPSETIDGALIETEFDRDPPTIDAPYDTRTINAYLACDFLEIWLYNTRTGEIVRKFNLTAPAGSR